MHANNAEIMTLMIYKVNDFFSFLKKLSARNSSSSKPRICDYPDSFLLRIRQAFDDVRK